MTKNSILWRGKTALGILTVAVGLAFAALFYKSVRRFLVEEIETRRLIATIRLLGAFTGHPVVLMRTLAY